MARNTMQRIRIALLIPPLGTSTYSYPGPGPQYRATVALALPVTRLGANT